MSDEQDKLKLSLEPPKLFGRKKKSDATGTSKRTSPAAADQESEATAADEPTEDIVDEPVAQELETAEPAAEEPEPEPVAEVTPEPTPEPAPVADPIATPEPEPRPVPQKAAAPTAPAARTAPAAKAGAAARSAATKASGAAKKAVRPRAKLAPDIEPEPVTSTDYEDAEIAAQGDEPPLLPTYPAAAVTGAVVGAAMIVLILLSLRGCEAVRGSSTCTGGPGFVLLVATFVACVLLGSALLKVFSIPDPGSSSFLGVGLVAVMALLFLIEVLEHWSMLIVIPIISVGAFLASIWVTKTFVEPGTDT